MRAAVIGIGSNSLRLLVADICKENQTAILRKRIGLRVFASLNQQLEIDENMIHKACEGVAMLKQTAIMLGAEIIRLFATSAVRDAVNKAAFAKALLQKTDLTLDICSGELEARLSFLGAAGEGSAGMIDIGGGSTEIVIGEHGKPTFSCSLQAGAVRLFQEISISTVANVQYVINAVKMLLAPHMSNIEQLKTPTEWVGVGGTLTAAATSIQDVKWNSHESIQGFIAKISEIRRVTETLAGMTLDQRRIQGSIPPDRADIIVHGLSILLACMEALQIDAITISEYTNLDGYLKLITAGESGSME